MKKINIFLIVLVLILNSCSLKKNTVYFHDIDAASMTEINNTYKNDYPIKIAKGDVLIISVSALDPEAVALFNLPLISYSTPGSLAINTSPVLQYYVVEPDGSINFPVVGKIQIADLTTVEAADVIAKQIGHYAKNPVVSLRYLNYQITILGEVNQPGRYMFNSQRITILDAIGMASDLTFFGKRKNVLIIRENNGKLEYGRVDLTSKNLFTSPYYFLKQNDIVYVEPSGDRIVASQNVNLYMSIFSTITTLSAVIFSFLK